MDMQTIYVVNAYLGETKTRCFKVFRTPEAAKSSVCKLVALCNAGGIMLRGSITPHKAEGNDFLPDDTNKVNIDNNFHP